VQPSRDKKVIAVESLVAFLAVLQIVRSNCPKRDVRFDAAIKIISFVALVNKHGNCAARGESFHVILYLGIYPAIYFVIIK